MAGSVSRSTHSLPEGSRAAEAPGRPPPAPPQPQPQPAPSAAEVLALQRSAGNHAVGNMLARRDPEEGTKTAFSAKVYSKKSKWGELSIKLSRAATGPSSGADWPPYAQQPKFELEFGEGLAGKLKLTTPAFTLTPLESDELEVMGLRIKGKIETKFLEAKVETGDAKKALGEDLSPATVSFKGVAKDAEGGGFEVEVKVALSTAGLARAMQSLTAKDRAALKQMDKISEQLKQHAKEIDQLADRVEKAQQGVDAAADAVAAKEAEIEKIKQSGGKVSKRMRADLSRAQRELKKQRKATVRLAKRLRGVLDTVEGLTSKLDDAAKKGTSRLFKALGGNLWKTVGPILKASLTRLLGVIGAIQTLVDVAAVLRNILNGRIFQEGSGGDPWADTSGGDADGGPEAPAGPEGEATEEGAATDAGGEAEGGGGAEGGEETGAGGTGGDGPEGGTGTEPGTETGTATGTETGTGTGTETGTATGTETGTGTGPTGGTPDKDTGEQEGAETEGKETDGGAGPDGPGSAGKEEAGGDAEGKGDLPDEGGREAPAVHVRPHKVKGPGEDDVVVDLLRDMTIVSGISSRRRHKVGSRLTPTLEFNASAARYRVKGLPVIVTNYFRDDDGYYLEATVSGNHRLGKTKIVVVEGTEITWDYTFDKKGR